MAARPTPGASFWSLLDDAARAALRRAGRLATYPPKAVLLRQYEQGDHLLVIRRGCVKVATDPGVGSEAVLAIRNPGDLVGEQARLDGGPRSATVHALTAVEALLIPASRFGHVLRTVPTVAEALEHILSERLREADGHRAATRAGAVQARLAALLLELGERYGRSTPGTDRAEIRIALPLSQDDLAGLVLSSRRTVSRVLEQWREQGWVVTGRTTLVLRDPEALREQTADGAG